MAAEFEIIDRGWNKAFAAFAEVNGAEAKAGIVDNEETARYGIIWEGRIGWLRDATDSTSREIGAGLVRLQRDLVLGQDPAKPIEDIVETLSVRMQNRIIAEGLKATGALVESITHEVKI